MNNVLYMMIGLPASGKSTWVDIKLDEIHGTFSVISTDDYIMIHKPINKNYDEVFVDMIDDATKAMDEKIKSSVENKVETIFWDQTNLDVKSRKKKLSKIPDFYKKIAVVFPVGDEEEWQKRLSSRKGKSIPDFVIENMKKNFVNPSFDEDFDEIHYINNFKE